MAQHRKGFYQKCLQHIFLGSISTSVSAGTHISCLTQGFVPLDVAYEITDGSTVSTNPQAPILTYKSSGTNPMTEAVWNAGYMPPPPYSRNTTRNLQFNESQFIASPGQVVCDTSYITTTDGYTWGTMSMAINAMWPYDSKQYSGQSAVNTYYAGNLVTTPPKGSVKITVNYKAQNMRFWANQDGVPAGTRGATPLNRYFVTDQWHNEYIMHASGQSTDSGVQQAFNDAVLPDGWHKSTRQLKKDLTIYPSVGSDGTFQYCIFRDSADNTYHQISWSGKGSLEAQVPEMPIWGGQHSDTLAGDANGQTDDVIHGAGGNDRILPGSGSDTVWGDNGIDTVILPGTLHDFSLVALSSDFTLLELFSPTYGSKTIRYCEYLKIGGKTIPIKDIKKSL
ncbi:MAG: hypothetical protein RLZ25_1226 [Pseudomonadota bacterium]|jgi:hypothetical protein